MYELTIDINLDDLESTIDTEELFDDETLRLLFQIESVYNKREQKYIRRLFV